MSTGYPIYDQYGMYFLMLTVVDWVEVFSRKTYWDIIVDSLKYCSPLGEVFRLRLTGRQVFRLASQLPNLPN